MVTGIACGPYTSAFIVTETVPVSSLSSKSGYLATNNKRHSVYMCGLNASGQCGIGKDAQANGGQNTKCIIRPTLVNLPPFMFSDEVGAISSKNTSRYITAGSAKSSFPFNLLGGSSSREVATTEKASLPNYCGDIQISLAKHHTILHHIPTNRMFSWGSSMYGQLGLSHLSNQDTINISSIGIGSGNAHAAERRRIRVPTELTIPHLSGGKPVHIQSVNGEDVTITGVLDIKPNRTSLNYIVGITSGEHHNLLLSNKIYVEEISPVPCAQTITSDKKQSIYKLVNEKTSALSTATASSKPIVAANYIVNANNTQIYSWGYNSEGQCGHTGSVSHVKTPKILDFFNCELDGNVDTDVCVTSIHCGYNYSMVTTNMSKMVKDVILPGRCGAGNTFSGRSANVHKKSGGLNVWKDTNTSGSHCSVYGWGYNDGGWMGLVVPNAALPGAVQSKSVPQQPPLPFIDTDRVKHGDIFPVNQARLFDCNCIVITPTRIKSIVPPVLNAQNAGSNEAIVPSRPDSASSGGEFYAPVTIRCGYSHSIVCLHRSSVPTLEDNKNSDEVSIVTNNSAIRRVPSECARSEASMNIRMDISDDSDEEGVNSKTEAKETSGDTGLFNNKSSMLAGMFGSAPKTKASSSSAKTNHDKSTKSNEQLIKELFHIVKYHKTLEHKADALKNKNALVDEFMKLLNEITVKNAKPSASNSPTESSIQYNINASIVDVSDDNNTLLVSLCKYFMRPLSDTASSSANAPYDAVTHMKRMQLLHILKYILSNCFDVIENQAVSIINHKNSLGNTALHYACHRSNTCSTVNDNSNLSTELTGKHISDYILSLKGSSTVIPVLDIPIVYAIDDCIVNNAGLTCYEGLVREDLECL